MTVSVPISELKQHTGLIVSRAVENREDVVIEKYGRDYAVLLSAQRYRELLNAAKNRVRERLREAQEVVHTATKEIPFDEIDEIVHSTIQTSRRERTIQP
ncbi:MAG: type II toxin-antitoxin system Phd/YefM family antitoxin [Chloroflexi bacterium]|nr:type II toxin-antitoxin system Phd/YefM family antitoxin [Chloroflexota bacterium]